jgi:hypothetical protein
VCGGAFWTCALGALLAFAQHVEKDRPLPTAVAHAACDLLQAWDAKKLDHWRRLNGIAGLLGSFTWFT